MLRWMKGASLSGSDGLTWKRCTISGQIPPMRMADSTSNPNPSSGSNQPGRTTLPKNNRAQMIEMIISTFLDGSTAYLSV